jgi:CRISPR-associated endonuclease/helicase Cas3
MTMQQNIEYWLARPEDEGAPEEELGPHLHGVADHASQYAAKLGYPALAQNLGLYHDAGKALTHFREYLLGNRDRDGYNHSAAGALLANSDLAVSIASHHTGLRSRADVANELNDEAQESRVQMAFENARELIGNALAEGEHLPEDPMRRAFLLRMLHSTLIDADWTRVAKHSGTFEPPESPSIGTLLDRMIAAQEAITDRSSQINRIRADIRQQCIEAAQGPPGIYTASIPTGGGKTRALMEMALRHAEQHDLDRVIVLAPYVSILRQSAGVYRKILEQEEDERTAVLEHHGNVSLEQASTREYSRATSRWDRPVIVSTFVQALESLMHTSNSRLRKIHRFANSVVILDEVQNVPYDLRETTIWLLEELEELGTTVITSSATQIPMPGTEVIDDPPDLYRRMKRVEYEHDPDEHSLEALWERAEPCTMIVANTTADARRLAEANPAAYHLSTKMTPAHRRSVVQEIKSRLDPNQGEEREDVQLVTTQLVEAGINLDFDFGIRLWGPMDNVIQAGGRVNRERRSGLAPVLVTKLEEGSLPPGAYEAGTEVHEEMFELHGSMDLNDPEWLGRYYDRMESRVSSAHPQIASALQDLEYPTADDEYELIDDAQQVDLLIQDPEFGAFEALVEQLRNAELSRPLLLEAQKYSISPYLWQIEDHLEDDNAILLREDADLYLWTGTYDDRLGLA